MSYLENDRLLEKLNAIFSLGTSAFVFIKLKIAMLKK